MVLKSEKSIHPNHREPPTRRHKSVKNMQIVWDKSTSCLSASETYLKKRRRTVENQGVSRKAKAPDAENRYKKVILSFSFFF